MRVLLMSATGNGESEPSLSSMRILLQGMGIPYDEYAVSKTTADATIKYTGDPSSVLVDPLDSTHGLYQALLVTTYNLAGIPASQWTAVTEYCTNFRVRIAYLYSYPYPELGVTIGPGGGTGSQFRFGYEFDQF